MIKCFLWWVMLSKVANIAENEVTPVRLRLFLSLSLSVLSTQETASVSVCIL